ncbi:MAG: LpxI family protein [Candidatus Binatia bacterium]
MDKIGLIAGNGSFPLLFAREARAKGYEVVAVAHKGETREEIDGEADSVTWVRVGQLGRTIRAFKRQGVTRAVMAGGINKVRTIASVRPDWRGLRFLGTAVRRGDDALLRKLASEFESEGVEIVPSTLFLERIIAGRGLLAGPRPSAAALTDVKLGCRVLGALGRLDVGQGVVVEKGVVLAVEAIEGTDAAIRRGCDMATGPAVVVKIAKVDQDMRFDVPAIGPGTLRTMADCGAGTLAVEAGSTIILEEEGLAEIAESHGISVVGCDRHGDIADAG